MAHDVEKNEFKVSSGGVSGAGSRKDSGEQTLLNNSCLKHKWMTVVITHADIMTLSLNCCDKMRGPILKGSWVRDLDDEFCLDRIW